MAAGGIDDIFIGYPVWAEGPKADRLRSLHSATPLVVGVDSEAGAERLAAAVAGSPTGSLRPRRDRLGRASDAASRARTPSLAVARRARDAGLEVDRRLHPRRPRLSRTRGAGPAPPPTRSRRSARPQTPSDAEGFSVERISAGSTPTGVLAAAGQVNEIRPGTYLLGDRQQVALGAIPAGWHRPRGRGDRRQHRGRRPGRPRRRREGADQGSGAVPRGLRVDPGLPGARDRAALRLPRGASTFPPGSRRAAPRRDRRDRARTTSVRSSTCSTTSSSPAAVTSIGRWPVDARGRSR